MIRNWRDYIFKLFFLSIEEMVPKKGMKLHIQLCTNVFDVSSESEDETQLDRLALHIILY